MSDALFTQILKVTESNIKGSKRDPRSYSGTAKPTDKCPPPPTTDTIPPISPAAGGSKIRTTTPFLKEVIMNEKKTVESLLKLAAKMGPIAQTVVEEEKAYDAAFEADVPAPIPTYTSTLQGFTFVMFFFSYLAFTIVMTVFVNATTGNAASAGGTLGGLLVLGVIIFALLKRFA